MIMLATFLDNMLIELRLEIGKFEMINMNWEKCCWPIAGEGIFHGKCNIQSELATSYILAEYISI